MPPDCTTRQSNATSSWACCPLLPAIPYCRSGIFQGRQALLGERVRRTWIFHLRLLYTAIHDACRIVLAILLSDVAKPKPDCRIWFFHLGHLHRLEEQFACLAGLASFRVKARERMEDAKVRILGQIISPPRRVDCILIARG